MKRLILLFASFAACGAVAAHASPICPTTANTNTDCGYIITIGPGGALTGTPVANANPYDGGDDALVGVVNNSGAAYTGSIFLSGSGNGGGIFGFDGDGICTYTHAAYCSTSAPTGYEGPNNSFSGINAATTSGYVNFTNVAAGGTTFFSLEGAPQTITLNITTAPEPSSLVLLGSGLAGLGGILRRRLWSRT